MHLTKRATGEALEKLHSVTAAWGTLSDGGEQTGHLAAGRGSTAKSMAEVHLAMERGICLCKFKKALPEQFKLMGLQQLKWALETWPTLETGGACSMAGCGAYLENRGHNFTIQAKLEKRVCF